MKSPTKKIVLDLLVKQIRRDGVIPGIFFRSARRSKCGAAMQSICRCKVGLDKGLPKIILEGKPKETLTVYDASVLIEKLCEIEGRVEIRLDSYGRLSEEYMVSLIKDREKVYSALITGGFLYPEDNFPKVCLDHFWWGDQNGDDAIKDEFDRKVDEIVCMDMGFDETCDRLRSLFMSLPLNKNKRLYVCGKNPILLYFMQKRILNEIRQEKQNAEKQTAIL